MAGIYISLELRPCIIYGKGKALFHRWIDIAEVVGESPLIGGHSAGQLWCVVGLVEDDKGKIFKVAPQDIQFTDNKIDDYCWD